MIYCKPALLLEKWQYNRRRRHMKLFSLNTHSLEEPDYERKLTRLAKGLLALQPDVTAFQEVNQTIGGLAVSL